MKAMERINNTISAVNAARENEKLAQRLVGEDTQSILTLKKNDATMNLTNAYSIIAELAKLGYVAGSKIGQIISLTCVCEALKDRELNKQFLAKDETVLVDLLKLSLVFNNIATDPNFAIEGYTSVFTPEEHAIVTDKLNRTQTILRGCKEKIGEFSETLKRVSVLTLDDLVVIGRDLEIVATVMSELEIDAAKDEEKRKGMIDISEFMNEYMKQSSRNFKMMHNFENIKKAKRDGNNKLELNVALCTDKTLFDFEEILEELTEEAKTTSEKTGEEMPTESELKASALQYCTVKDPLFDLNEELLNVVSGDLTLLGGYYNEATMDLFEGFDITPVINPALNLTNETPEQSKIFVQRTFIKLYDMINSIYKFKKYLPMVKIEEVAATVRNIGYTVGAERGMTPEDTFYLGVSAGWLKELGTDKVTPRGYFRYKAIETVFSTELKTHFKSSAMSSEVELEVPEELFEVEDLFEDGKLFDFENGSCEVMGVDGEYYSIIRTDNIDFTGRVLVEIDAEGYLTFLEPLNPYDFEMTNFFMLDSISDMRKAENRLDADSLANLIEQDIKSVYAFGQHYNKSRIVDTVPAFAEEVDTLKFANTFKDAFVEFDNKIKLPVEFKERFSLIPNRRRSHLYLKDNLSGAARMAGEINTYRMTKSIKDCNSMEVISTPAGAILVTK